jgi:phospholipase C
MTNFRRSVCTLSAVALTTSLIAACSGPMTRAVPPSSEEPMSARTTSSSLGKYIRHIVVIVQENRSFENLFAGWPGADAPTYGYSHTGRRIALHEMTYADDCTFVRGQIYCDIGHLWQQAVQSWDEGKMDRFDLNGFGSLGKGLRVRSYPYAYLDHAEIAPYRAMASQYVLADRMFPTEFGTSFTAHQDLIAGTTRINATHSLVNIPQVPPWGCDAFPGTKAPLVNTQRKLSNNGPFPCFDQYPTMADTLDTANVSWKYYAPSVNNSAGSIWSAFSAIKNVYYGRDWKRNVISPETKVFGDASRGTLPSVAWVIPDYLWSDHPSVTSNWGPSWVGDVVNEIGESKDWNSTAIVILWDDWGGWYDNAPPPQLDYVGLGIRVPCIIVSPYAKKGYVSHTRYEFGSILQFIEDAYNLPRLGSTDVRANSLLDSFDFTQKPRAFLPIETQHPSSFFLKKAPSMRPPDDD